MPPIARPAALVTACCSATETVVDGRTGRVLPSLDEAAWSGALLDLLTDPAGARAAGERGRRLVAERFGPERSRRTLRAALRLEPDPVP